MPTRRRETDPATALLPLHPPTSPLAWVVGGGLLLLAVIFYLIVADAHRSARTERRGDLVAAVLLQEAVAISPIDWGVEWQRRHLFARVVAAASAADVFTGDLELLPLRDDSSLTLMNKHYVVELRPSAAAVPPRDSGGDDDADVGDVPLEVMAWPREVVGPAHTVFFYPEDADPAFSRNLQSAYVDSDPSRRPHPGRAHRRTGNRRIWDYRGLDDERWLLRDRPHVDPAQ